MKKTNESGLSRIEHFIRNHSCGIITAFRGEYSYKENKERNKALLQRLLGRGYGVTSIQGSYIESGKHVNESSFFVANYKVEGDDDGQLENDLFKLGNYYDQESILSIRNGKAYLVGTKKEAEEGEELWIKFGEKIEVGTGKYGSEELKAREFLSKIKGRPFVFESGTTGKSDNWMSRYARHVAVNRMLDEDMKHLNNLLDDNLQENEDNG